MGDLFWYETVMKVMEFKSISDQQVATSNLLISNAAQNAHPDQDKCNNSGECNKMLESIILLSTRKMFSVSHISVNLFQTR